MPIIQKKVLVKCTKINKEHYIKRGYTSIQLGDKFEINVLDLYPGSHELVECKCDYCGTTIFKEFRAVNPNRRVDAINQLKVNCSNIICVNKKIEETNLEKYGCKNALQNKEIRNKTKETWIKKYGVDNPWKSEKIKEKIKQTFIKKYGTDNYAKTEEFLVKSKNTFLRNYGVDNPMKYDKIKNRALVKSKNTMHIKGNAPCSKQQKYICNLVNGKLNYPIDRCTLDIAFPEQKIYIEYDGSGHKLSIGLGYSLKEYNKKQRARKAFLQTLGWKLIRVISLKDKLLQDNDILNLINEAKNYLLNSNHSWVEIDIDQLEYRCSEYSKKLLFNNLINTKGKL